MYIPPHFEETRAEILRQAMREYPLAAVVTLGPDGLNANHLPLAFDPEPEPFGTLRGHVSRANAMWREASQDVDTLAIFQGPSAYVSPSWYPSKHESGGRVVPTYNYIVVHAYGRVRFIEEADWLHAHLSRLTAHFEEARPEPWRLTDTPPGFVEGLLKGIVGFELTVTRLLGKWKMSQNRSEADRASVLRHLST